MDRQLSESVDVSATKLTDWQKEPSLRDLKQDYQDALPVHQAQVARIDRWLDNLHITGSAKIQAAKGSSSVQPKLIRKQAEWRYAALSEPFLSAEDMFEIEPLTWEDRLAAVQNALILNNQFNTQIDKVAFIDEYVRTAVDEGTVTVKVGWDFQEVIEEINAPVIELTVNPQMAEVHQQVAEMRQANPAEYAQLPEELRVAHESSVEDGVPYEGTITGYEKQPVMRTVRNQPTLEVCSYRNLVMDPTCQGNPDKAGFFIHSFESSKSELAKDKRYKNLEAINLNTNSILGEPDHTPAGDTQNFNFSDEARKKFVVYEYHGFYDIDGSGQVTPILAAWVGDTLIRLEKNPFPDKQLPFVTVQYLPVRKHTHGEPDGELLEDNQRIIGAVTRGMIDLLGKSANGQTGIRKDMLDVANRRKFEKGLDYEFNQNVDPRQGVYMHTYPEIPSSAQFMLQLQNMDAESLTGVQAFTSQGLSGASLGETATGVRGALDAASKRELGILRRLAAGMVKIGRKILAMNSEFLSEEEIVRVTNEEFVTVRRDDLAGKFDLRLAVSTPEENAAKAQDLAFMLQTMGPQLPPEIAKIILIEIARLKKIPDLVKQLKNYQPQPDPIAQRKAELEVAHLEADLQIKQFEAQKLQAETQRLMAQANTEQAKTGKLQSETDRNTLDFVEQEAGVKQERELEKQGAQARAQAQTKVLEHYLKSREKSPAKA